MSLNALIRVLYTSRAHQESNEDIVLWGMEEVSGRHIGSGCKGGVDELQILDCNEKRV